MSNILHVKPNFYQTDSSITSGITIGDIPKKLEPPKLPDFILKNEALWQSFCKYLETKQEKDEPFLMRCNTFTKMLFVQLVMNYKGTIESNGKIFLTIDGKKAQVIPVRTFYGFEMEHFWLELQFENESDPWIIDPTWKQFAFEEGPIHFDDSNSYDLIILKDYPDIMVGKKSDFEKLFLGLGEHLRAQGKTDAGDARAYFTTVWDKDWRYRDSNYSYRDWSDDYIDIFKKGQDPSHKPSEHADSVAREIERDWQLLKKCSGCQYDTFKAYAKSILPSTYKPKEKVESKYPKTDDSKSNSSS